MHRPLPPFKLAIRIALLVLLALFPGAVGMGAQLVTPKTVPVLQDEQFNLVPSSRPGLGSPFIALEDTLGDPFVNPAKAARLHAMSVAVAPYTHDISGNRGGGSTLPAALLAAGGAWSGGLLAAYQNLNRVGPQLGQPASERTSSNQYIAAVLARRIGTLSLGAGVSHAGLGAVDGVDLLYAGSDGIEQSGHMTEYRLGAHKEWGPGHALELLGIHGRTDMTHDVHFTRWSWDPVLKQSVMTQRQDHNLDQTRIWGVHSTYYQPVGTDGWRVGVLATADRLSHPKIPNYSVQNVPRDPGTTHGYAAGLGVARLAGRSSFFADLVAEPMTSDTWADLPRDTTDTAGALIPAGSRTIENHFDFHNATARVGAGYVFPVSADSGSTVGFDAGLALNTIDYRLHQTNNVARTTRAQSEHWSELTQSIGVRFRSRDLEVSYTFRRTCGNQGCGDEPEVFNFPVAAAIDGGGIIAAPSAPLFIRGGKETSHRFMVAVPIR
jgi:hypothetical protein